MCDGKRAGGGRKRAGCGFASFTMGAKTPSVSLPNTVEQMGKLLYSVSELIDVLIILAGSVNHTRE